jgi:phospholipid transport system transporter-binding protein
MNTVRIEPAGDGRVRIEGELSFATVATLLTRMAALSAGQDDLGIDLQGVTRADSAGVALLVEWLRMARRENRKLHYLNMPAQMLAIARVSGLDVLLPLQRG